MPQIKSRVTRSVFFTTLNLKINSDPVLNSLETLKHHMHVIVAKSEEFLFNGYQFRGLNITSVHSWIYIGILMMGFGNLKVLIVIFVLKSC